MSKFFIWTFEISPGVFVVVGITTPEVAREIRNHVDYDKFDNLYWSEIDNYGLGYFYTLFSRKQIFNVCYGLCESFGDYNGK